MLTVKQILKIGRLLDQTGEPRPGFLHDDTDNFEGQGSALEHGAIPNCASVPLQAANSGSEKSVKITLEYQLDETTGDVRLIAR